MTAQLTGAIHIIDSDPAVRAGLARSLAAFGIACRLHATGDDALRALGPATVCIVAEAELPDMDAVELIAEAALRGCTAPVLVVTAEGDVEAAVRAMKAGAADCVAKPLPAATLAERVRGCLAAETPEAQRRQRARDADRRLALLSRREAEVLRLIVEGKQSKTIAWELGISIKTIEVHRARIMEKTGCGSIVALGRLWEAAACLRERSAQPVRRPVPAEDLCLAVS
ncbi:response regulator transcription factor [Azospirillum thermophilum]|uniref:DNA-binding response regulator n=1 Tax=Azospirillum thermophilum TaxID=2202148 RepID=A0A2S2CP39_9PROT|nr:LuxR C-terminal-related transcriptional regulator [Azospirillum thermophilum]AWK86271.1 DNA-binding response regulator [Azospirillum thermophilum]